MTKSDLAIRYNDQSVLEMHHAAVSFDALMKVGFMKQVMDTYSQQQSQGFRKKFISSIVQTDMKYHAEHVKVAAEFAPYKKYLAKQEERTMHKLKELSWSLTVTSNSIELQNDDTIDDIKVSLSEDEKETAICLILHAADIGNTGMERQQCLKWKDRILQEFADQGAHEKLLGLPVTPFMQGLDDPVTQLRSQIGFINFVVQPYYENLCSSFFMEIAISNVCGNKAYYTRVLEDYSAGESNGWKPSVILPYPRAGSEELKPTEIHFG